MIEHRSVALKFILFALIVLKSASPKNTFVTSMSLEEIQPNTSNQTKCNDGLDGESYDDKRNNTTGLLYIHKSMKAFWLMVTYMSYARRKE